MPKEKIYKKRQNLLKRLWDFVWHEDSVWSWIFDTILAVLIVKLLIYPGLGAVMGTDRPVVAVISESMEHNGLSFDEWYNTKGRWYDTRFTKEEMEKWNFKNGFNKGDIIFLKGAKDLKKGDVIVFQGVGTTPIIHRIIDVYERNGKTVYQTKGDNNADSYPGLGELDIPQEKIIGKGSFKIPYVGWVKIVVSNAYNKVFK